MRRAAVVVLFFVALSTHAAYTSLVVLGQDPITKPAESARGALVEFEVHAVGGMDPNPVVTCDWKSGSIFPIGPTWVHCVATNASRERAEGGLYIYVYDTGLPVIHVPLRIEQEAQSREGNIVAFEVSASDVVDGPLPVSCDAKSGSRFPIGVTIVTCIATDSSGNSMWDSFDIEIIDPNAPDPDPDPDPGKLVIHVPAGIEAEAESADGAHVHFDVTADGSSDPHPIIECDPSSGSLFAIGMTNVTCVATDRFGATARGTFTITVTDTVGPLIIDLTASPDVLEPPNHKFVPVTITAEVRDVVDAAPQCSILDVTANQTLGDDVHITGDLTLELRAERDNGNERVYSIHVQCIDSANNTSRGEVRVRVPQGSHDETQVSQPQPEPRHPSKRRSVGRG